jgi:hypothetical protein
VAEVELPDVIELTLAESGVVLDALDQAEVLARPRSEAWRLIRAGIVLLTRKLWPELGRLLDDGEE